MPQKSMDFEQRYREFLNGLEDIYNTHEELTDTEVRDRLHEVINWYFVWRNPINSEFPQFYGMFSPEGDADVAQIVRSFIEDICQLAANSQPGAERHRMLENPNIEIKTGISYDYFLGSSDQPIPPTKPADDSFYGEYL